MGRHQRFCCCLGFMNRIKTPTKYLKWKWSFSIFNNRVNYSDSERSPSQKLSPLNCKDFNFRVIFFLNMTLQNMNPFKQSDHKCFIMMIWVTWNKPESFPRTTAAVGPVWKLQLPSVDVIREKSQDVCETSAGSIQVFIKPCILSERLSRRSLSSHIDSPRGPESRPQHSDFISDFDEDGEVMLLLGPLIFHFL